MEIIIKTTNIRLTEGLRNFIEEKLGELEKFLTALLEKMDVFDGQKPRVRAFVEIGKPSRHHRKGDVFYVECQIPLPGRGLRAEAERGNLKLAICEVKDELQRELKEYKGIQAAKQKRSQRKIKKDLNLSPAARFYRKGRIREEGI